MKKRVFIASSSESLDIAYAIQENLEKNFEITVWPQDAFKVGNFPIEDIMKTTESTDSAIFVFTADDVVTIRNKTTTQVRDNVLFELGVFIGALGRENCFIVQPSQNAPDLPTDLIGITPATYEPERSDGNWMAALGPACQKIKRKIDPTISSKTSKITSDTPVHDFIKGTRFRLMLNPLKGGSKTIVFGNDGLIIEGNNRNEHRWKLSGDVLEIYNLQEKLFSRFIYNKTERTFIEKNEEASLPVRNQKIIFDN